MMLIAGEQVPWNSIGELLRARALQHGDAPRVDVAETVTSWGELDRESDRMAASLSGCGVSAGDRVCSMMDGRIEQLIVWFGTVKLGAIWVPLNTGLIGDDLVYTLRDAAPKALFIEGTIAPRFLDWPSDAPLPSVCVATEAVPDFQHWNGFMASGSVPPKVEVQSHDAGVIIYTGGTTGRPKGVVMPHFAFIAAGYRFRDAFDVTAADHQYSVLPLFHVGGTMLGVMGPLVTDIPTTLERRFSGTRFWPRAKSRGATLIDPVGTMVTLLTQQPQTSADRDHRVRASVGVTGQVPPGIAPTFTRRFGVQMVNLYSLTEAGGVLITYTKPTSARPEAHGEPGRWADFRVVDALDQEKPAGETGEIVLRPRLPYTFMLRYHNDPVRTLECWSNLWLHTGDLGRVDDKGFLHFVGRQAHWLRCRGENVSAYEVETVVSAHPGVAEAAVVGVPAALGEEEVKVFIVRTDNADYNVTPDAVVEWCAARLARFKVPRFVEFVQVLPRSTAKQEIERHKLRALPNDNAWDARTAESLARKGKAQQ